MIEYLIVIVPLLLLALGIGLYHLIRAAHRAFRDAIEYLKERKELKWM